MKPCIPIFCNSQFCYNCCLNYSMKVHVGPPFLTWPMQSNQVRMRMGSSSAAAEQVWKWVSQSWKKVVERGGGGGGGSDTFFSEFPQIILFSTFTCHLHAKSVGHAHTVEKVGGPLAHMAHTVPPPLMEVKETNIYNMKFWLINWNIYIFKLKFYLK